MTCAIYGCQCISCHLYCPLPIENNSYSVRAGRSNRSSSTTSCSRTCSYEQSGEHDDGRVGLRHALVVQALQQAASKPAVRFAAPLPIAELRVYAVHRRVQGQLCLEDSEVLFLHSLNLKIIRTKHQLRTVLPGRLADPGVFGGSLQQQDGHKRCWPKRSIASQCFGVNCPVLVCFILALHNKGQ